VLYSEVKHEVSLDPRFFRCAVIPFLILVLINNDVVHQPRPAEMALQNPGGNRRQQRRKRDVNGFIVLPSAPQVLTPRPRAGA
jgi:hypothetical protein